MTAHIEALLEAIRLKAHNVHRRTVDFPDASRFGGAKDALRVTQALCDVLSAETPLILGEEKLLYFRTVKNLPQIFTEPEWSAVRQVHFIHEQGRVCNISPNYASVIGTGLLALREQIASVRTAQEEGQTLYDCTLRSIDAVLGLAERYRAAALAVGKVDAVRVLSRVPAYRAETFWEALQFLRILHFTLWCEGEYHNTLGRFDQYMYPYLKADLEDGRLTEDDAFELVQEFFLSLNRDSDLYPGIQQGDNGQSMMLGGVDADGNDCFNLLSAMCLRASRELKLIDPKINLRVSKHTPLSTYVDGTLLTRQGLGFPQYSNDDVVIDGLLKKGYRLEDARNYTVAACWEFIVPGVGMDIPNIGAVNFPSIVNSCINADLEASESYDEFFTHVCERLNAQCTDILQKTKNLYLIPAPFMSLLMDGCIARGRDISLGSRYNNYGFHGVGLSTAIDSLYALKKLVYQEQSLTKAQAREIITSGWEGKDALFARLRYETEKFGNAVSAVDDIACSLIEAFGNATEPLVNERGGCVRAGTGSAMFYLWHAEQIGDALSGHRQGDPFSANYSPELFVRNRGPLSVIRSFTRPDLSCVINGGPLTMEFHATVFRDEQSVQKVAMLVKTFIDSGGHQLQLNATNRDMLLDAQLHPENHRHLIVRIWGWSAYFVELDKAYQDHVIARQEFLL